MVDYEINTYQKNLESKSSQEVIFWAIDHFGVNNILQASSLGIEDQIITDMMMKINPEVNIFTLDTGRLHQETYNTLEETRKKYNKNIDIVFPEPDAVEHMVNSKGPNLFYESVENRKLCCRIRKVEPLKRKLFGIKAWICGLRRDQSQTRMGLDIIEWDINLQIIKINPLIAWNEQQVWDYLRIHKVPYNKLHDQGYPSIGCDCCTRAVKSGEDIRAGRWWWEDPEQKECGLHNKS